jgi:predicted NUDIX family phosphoesterase
MEFVYVVNRVDLFELPMPHGFVGPTPPEGHPTLDEYLRRIATRGYFVERSWAEQQSSLKQIIPYTLVCHGSKLFLTRRLNRGGEKRLYGKRSVGIGGHINPEDDTGDRQALVFAGARREINEELQLDTSHDLAPVGIINDDATPVGSVHFGVVLVARLASAAAQIREKDQLEGGFAETREIQALSREPDANFETWSALILERIDAALGAPA